MKLLLKWTVLVYLSAVASLILATLDNQKFEHVLGMLLGIFTFVLIYFFIDLYLEKSNRQDLRKYLLLSIKIKMGLQLLPILEFYAGLFSTLTLSALFGSPASDAQILSAYLMTILVGLQLSLVVGVFFILIRFFKRHKLKAKS